MDTEYVYPQDKQDGTAGLARAGGLTLRDFFAGKAMCGMLAAAGAFALPRNAHQDAIADTAYDLADAMLAARTK